MGLAAGFGAPAPVQKVLAALPGIEVCASSFEPGEVELCNGSVRAGVCYPSGADANCRIRANANACPMNADMRHECDGSVLPFLNACNALPGTSCLTFTANLGCDLAADPDCDGDDCVSHPPPSDDPACIPPDCEDDPVGIVLGNCPCPPGTSGSRWPVCTKDCPPGSSGPAEPLCTPGCPLDPPPGGCGCPYGKFGYQPVCAPNPPPISTVCTAAVQWVLPYSEFVGSPDAADYYDVATYLESASWNYYLRLGAVGQRDSGATLHHSVGDPQWDFWPHMWSNANSWGKLAQANYDTVAYAGSDLSKGMDVARNDLVTLGGGHSDLSVVLVTTGDDLTSSAVVQDLARQAALAKSAGIRVGVIHVRDGYAQPSTGVWDNQAFLESIASYANVGTGSTTPGNFYYNVSTAQDVATGIYDFLTEAGLQNYSVDCVPNAPWPDCDPLGPMQCDELPCPIGDPTCVLDQPCPPPLSGGGMPYCFGSCPAPISGPAMPSCAGVCVGESEWCPSEACVYRSVPPPPPLNPNLQVCAASVVSCMAGNPACDAIRPYLQLIVGETDVCVGAYCHPALVCERDALTGTKCI